MVGADLAGRDDFLDRIDFTGQDRLDPAILAVADPTIDASVLGLACGPGAKADALDATANNQVAQMPHGDNAPGYDAPVTMPPVEPSCNGLADGKPCVHRWPQAPITARDRWCRVFAAARRPRPLHSSGWPGPA